VAALAIVAAGLATWGYVKRTPKPPRLIRFDVATPPEIVSVDTPRVSPDGRYVAFNATDATGKTRIWLRAMNALTPQPLAGTDGTARPFWSPDSRFLGFFAEGKLKKIDITGGPPQKVCDAPTGADGTWSPEGVILYDGRGADPIRRVSAAGGTPVDEVKPDPARNEGQVGWPEFLPDGKHFLYMAMGQKAEDNKYRIGSLDSKESTVMAPAQTLVTYAPPGYLLFVRDRTLVAQPFDAKALKTTGEPVPLAEKIGVDNVGLARFSVSREGTLAYRTGESGARLVWEDRDGKELGTAGDTGDSHNPVLAPRGDELAFDLVDPQGGNMDIWVRDLARGVNSRLTFSANVDFAPIWSPDGTRIVYSKDRGGPTDLYEKPADGTGDEKELLKTDVLAVASDWSRDGRYIAYQQFNKDTRFDILVLPTFGDRKPISFLKTPFDEAQAKFSPDGRFLVYQSNESGRPEIYVRNFPGPGGKWQISTAGGVDPFWRGDGKEIFYRALDQKIMAVDIEEKNGLQVGVPHALFLGRFQPGTARNRYVPAADGKRFVLVAPLGRDAMAPTTVVLNWFAGLGAK
jgi:Tol biopolymer transport system component